MKNARNSAERVRRAPEASVLAPPPGLLSWSSCLRLPKGLLTAWDVASVLPPPRHLGPWALVQSPERLPSALTTGPLTKHQAPNPDTGSLVEPGCVANGRRPLLTGWGPCEMQTGP